MNNILQNYTILLICLICFGCVKHPDYIETVQNKASSYQGVTIKKYVEDLYKYTKAAGGNVVSGGWTYQSSANGHIVKYNVEEYGKDISFVWVVDDSGNVRPQNDMAEKATGR